MATKSTKSHKKAEGSGFVCFVGPCFLPSSHCAVVAGGPRGAAIFVNTILTTNEEDEGCDAQFQ
jgi:hypothetical protein